MKFVYCVYYLCPKQAFPSFSILATNFVQTEVEEAARARVRCAWATTKFKKLSPILSSRCASYHILNGTDKRIVSRMC